MPRQNISSGRPMEAVFGYSRAVKVGDLVAVAGTAGTDENGKCVGQGDPYAQAVQALRIIEAALAEAGATLSDVIRTRVYVTDIRSAEGVQRAHGEVFGTIRPASTLVAVSALAAPDMLVEIEADAIIGARIEPS